MIMGAFALSISRLIVQSYLRHGSLLLSFALPQDALEVNTVFYGSRDQHATLSTPSGYLLQNIIQSKRALVVVNNTYHIESISVSRGNGFVIAPLP
jgi:hypothetical protein